MINSSNKLKNADKIFKSLIIGEQDIDDIKVEIINFANNNGIIEVYAKAWKNGKQFGFGANGNIETERFRFINSPIMVPDGTFTLNIYEGKEYKSENYKEDPKEAFLQILADTIRKVGKDNSKIIKGSIGNTTTTVFASYNAMIYFNNAGVDGTWATYHDALTGTAVDDTDQRWAARIDEGTALNSFAIISRTGFTFDTSPIGTDSISSAILSIHGDTTTNNNQSAYSVSINIFSFTPISSSLYVTSDYSVFGTTQFSTSIPFGSWSTGAYNDFTLNSSGIAVINKSGNTTIGSRESLWDAPNIAPTPATAGSRPTNRFGYNSYLASGTTLDPKMVIVHSVPSGPTNIKTWDGVTQSTGIKTYEALALASTKSVNGIT